MSEEYLKNHRASGLKIGDRVKITRTAKSEEGGWENTWIRRMNIYIGNKSYEIISDDRNSGYLLSNGYSFPYFVLEKVEERAKPKRVKNNSDIMAIQFARWLIMCYGDEDINSLDAEWYAKRYLEFKKMSSLWVAQDVVKEYNKLFKKIKDE